MQRKSKTIVRKDWKSKRADIVAVSKATRMGAEFVPSRLKSDSH
jgi:hypothetical protein